MHVSRLTYAFDAYCGWCYGFAPALHQFARDNAHRIDLTVLSGGLFVGSADNILSGHAAASISAYPHIPAANARISALTGVEFGEGYLEVLREGTLVMDSTDAATGLLALTRQDPTRTLEAAGAMQDAWYTHGSSLSEPATYARIAATLGLDVEAVTAALADPTLRTVAQAQFEEVAQLGVHAYPTLLLHTPEGPRKLGGPTSSAAALAEALDTLTGT
ncbi:DsbA family protein [Arthrobacter sp. TMS2-4]